MYNSYGLCNPYELYGSPDLYKSYELHNHVVFKLLKKELNFF